VKWYKSGERSGVVEKKKTSGAKTTRMSGRLYGNLKDHPLEWHLLALASDTNTDLRERPPPVRPPKDSGTFQKMGQ